MKAHPELADQSIMARLQVVADALRVPLAEDMKLYIDQGIDIPLPENAFDGCIRVMYQQVPVFALGYDPAATGAAEFFAGVNPDSNAYEAGLRDGMKQLERLSGNPDDSNTPLSFRIRDADGLEKVIIWLPRGNDHFERLHLVIPEGLDSTAQAVCASAVVGN